jgi:carbon monoxide dehydrogenase subunit G
VNLDGSAVLSAPPERVWEVITDPAVLARTIPGCETLEQTGDDEYRMNVTVGVGAIRGTYAGEVRLSDQKRPTSYVMHASGAGGPGNVRATVTINLEPHGEGTALTYSPHAVVGGPVAGVGQRMIQGVAKRMAGQFFKAIDELVGVVTPIAAAPSAVAAAGEVGAPVTAARSCSPARRHLPPARSAVKCGRSRSARSAAPS